MTEDSRVRIRDCGELSFGDEVDAWLNGRIYHHGRVIETYPSMGLFWILDARTGARRLLDVEALVIVRQLPVPPTATSGPEASVA
jgi:hypothetical protein